MSRVKTICWWLLATGFGVAFVDRTLSMDLLGVQVVGVFLILVLIVNPNWFN